ncbi:MAG: Mu transposase C-terminal domain-containing protein, partial [Desulfobulbaceae bacterium]|nr:Mu transposase C-terminal domain-containing protein [Desulfobulbaceae bacterium]
ERFCPTYTGTSIEMKPPRLNRGEKMHRRLYEKQFGSAVITMEQAHRAIAAWFDQYAQRPQRGHLDGQRPGEVFVEGRGEGVDRAALTYLMMSMEIKHINRNGISFQGKNYYHPELYGRRHPVTIRYDLQDLAALYVFDQDGAYLCQAMQVEGVHPAAEALGNDEDRDRLKLHIEHKRHQEKAASSVAREMLENEVLPQHRRQLEATGVLEEGQGMLPIAGRNSGKVLQLPLSKTEEERIEAEAAAMIAEAEDAGPNLSGLPDADRYEALMEREAQGAVSKDDAAFMRYFEATEEYSKNPDYWDERRMVFAVMYQTAQA